MTDDDAQLLKQFAVTGSEQAFTELVQRYASLVYSVACRQTGNAQQAQDVTQSVFLKFAHKAPSLPATTLLGGWFHRTTLFIALQERRAAWRRKMREEQSAQEKMIDSNKENEPSWEEIAPVLDPLLGKLSQTDRDVLIMRFFQQRSLGEVAHVLGCGETGAHQRVKRALEKLRAMLERRGIRCSSDLLSATLSAYAVKPIPAGLIAGLATGALASASAAAAVTNFSILNYSSAITMTKMKLATGAALAAAMATTLVVQHRTIHELRNENARILQERTERPTQNREPDRPVSSLPQEQLRELMRLRGEVTLLRRDSQDLARLRAQKASENTPAAAPNNIVSLPAETWANSGFATPQSALQTFFWAGRHGEADVLGNVIRWQRDPSLPDTPELGQAMTNLITSTTDFMPKVKDFSILSEEPENESTVKLRLALETKEGKRMEADVRIIKDQDQWFPLFNVWRNSKGDIIAAMDVPPVQPTTP